MLDTDAEPKLVTDATLTTFQVDAAGAWLAPLASPGPLTSPGVIGFANSTFGLSFLAGLAFAIIWVSDVEEAKGVGGSGVDEKGGRVALA